MQEGGSVSYETFLLAQGVTQPAIQIELVAADIPLAGGLADITQCITNQGSVPMDIVVRRNSGAAPGRHPTAPAQL